jgi:hypothetical protein
MEYAAVRSGLNIAFTGHAMQKPEDSPLALSRKPGVAAISFALKLFCMAILVVMTLKQTFLLPGPVSVHRVMGGIAAYLLIGVTWAFGYKLLLEMIPGAIHF